MAERRAEIAIIGGSGLYDFAGLEDVERISIDTPYGAPSGPIILGALGGRRVAFLARHGEGHELLPAEIPALANIWALKSLGVDCVLAVSAVGSLRAELEPLDVVIPDQLIDRTRARPSTFFGHGVVAHVGLADPFCEQTSRALHEAAGRVDPRATRGGTLVVIDGPTFSTRAESELHRAWGGTLVGMTALPEARLAREAELCYASLSFVTDFDVWHPAEADVSADVVMTRLRTIATRAQAMVANAVAAIPADRACGCRTALDGAVLTSPQAAMPEVRWRLAPILDRAWSSTVPANAAH